MFNIGFPELLLILMVALLVFGPSQLPKVGRSIGQAIREFKKAGEELTRIATEDPSEPSPPPIKPVAPASPETTAKP